MHDGMRSNYFGEEPPNGAEAPEFRAAGGWFAADKEGDDDEDEEQVFYDDEGWPGCSMCGVV